MFCSNLEGSTANKTVASILSQQENVEVRDIMAMYPDFKIDVQAERMVFRPGMPEEMKGQVEEKAKVLAEEVIAYIKAPVASLS